ncbi:MAG: tetratricopeptide repeat protein [Cyclobacteriaceae bacterium]|nr:tetratricopeptide repeat protein [Cyclobacteriaceae bacterium]
MEKHRFFYIQKRFKGLGTPQGILACFVVLTFLSFSLMQSCKEKPVDEKQLARDKITIRTLGLAYLEENKLEEAETEFLKLTKLAPDEALGFANLGLVYLRMDNYTEAIKQLDKAVEIDPKDANIRLIRSKAFELNNETDKAISELEETLEFAPEEAKALYQLADLYQKKPEAGDKRLEYLARVVEASPTNIVPRLQLIEMLLQKGETDQALKNLEEIGRQFPEFTPEAAEFYKKTMDGLHNGQPEEAMTSLLIFHNFLKLTTPYQAGIKELKGPGGALIGFPMISFSQSTASFLQEGESLLDAMRYTEVTATAGLELSGDFVPGSGQIAVADIDGDGDQDIFYTAKRAEQPAVPHLFVNDLGMFKETAASSGLDVNRQITFATFADYDNDGHLDLLLLLKEGLALYRNAGEGKFENTTDDAIPVAGGIAGQTALFVDADHDGDLDLFIGGENDQLWRNNADGTFTNTTESVGFGPQHSTTTKAMLGDFDDDGDIDWLVLRADGQHLLYSNLRQGKFKDIAKDTGLKDMPGPSVAATGDYNNDGYLDIFIATTDGSAYHLYKNKSDGTFEEDKASDGVFAALKSLKAREIIFVDVDNDGHLDILVMGENNNAQGNGMLLFHNDGWGNYKEINHLLPQEFNGGTQVVAADYNEDGDLDLYIAGLDGAIRLLRNDGGNGNHHLKMKLVGLRTGSGKTTTLALAPRWKCARATYTKCRW